MYDQYNIENKLRRLERNLNCKTRFYDSFLQFPEVGVSCALFVDKSNGDIYIWDGTQYVISSSGGGAGIQGIQGNTGLQGIQGIAGSGSESQPFAYGAFHDMTDQSVVSGSVAPMQYNTNDFASGVTIMSDTDANPTLIHFLNDYGVYNIQFSAQLYRDSGESAADIIIWLRKNGTDVPDTSTKIHMANNNTYAVASWNFLIDGFAGEQLQIMWTQNDGIILAHEAENLIVPYPAIPSVILTVTQVA